MNSTMTARSHLKTIVGSVVVLIASISLVQADDGSAIVIDPQSPFYTQLKAANDRYIENSIKQYLDSLDQLSQRVNKRSKILAADLDEGEKCAKSVAASAEAIVQFHDRHNARLDDWTKKDGINTRYSSPLKVTKEKIAEQRAQYPDWPLHPVLWKVPAMQAKLDGHDITQHGLRLDYDQWLSSQKTDKDHAEYAFFYFLRKACTETEPDILAFLDGQTGFKDYWHMSTSPRVLKRAGFDYYSYQYISPDAAWSKADGAGRLKRQALSQFAGKNRQANLNEFYAGKLAWFEKLTGEMRRQPSLKKGATPYLDLYAFTARSFPCISAFDVSGNDRAGYKFVAGWKGDYPFGTKDDPRPRFGNSPFGQGYSLFVDLIPDDSDESRRLLAEKLLAPLLLLQFRLETQTSRKSWPYEDLRVGYKGYLDLYHDLSVGKGATITFTQEGATVKGFNIENPNEEGIRNVIRILEKSQAEDEITPNNVAKRESKKRTNGVERILWIFWSALLAIAGVLAIVNKRSGSDSAVTKKRISQVILGFVLAWLIVGAVFAALHAARTLETQPDNPGRPKGDMEHDGAVRPDDFHQRRCWRNHADGRYHDHGRRVRGWDNLGIQQDGDRSAQRRLRVQVKSETRVINTS